MIPQLALPRKARARHVRILMGLAFALFPIAYFVGARVEMQNLRRIGHSDFHLTSNRAQAIQAARDFLSAQKIDVTQWNVYCSSFPNHDLYQYYRLHPGPEADRAAKVFPPAVVKVLFESPAADHRASMTLSFENQILGFDVRNAMPEPVRAEVEDQTAADDQASLALAESLLASESALASVFGHARPEVMNSDRGASGVTRSYTWHQPFPGLHELDSEFRLALRNGRVLSMAMNTTVDRDYAARAIHSKDEGITDALAILRALLIFSVAIYSVVSYARRTTQKEISHTRTLWMAGALTVISFAFGYFGPARDAAALLDPGAVSVLTTPILLLRLVAQAILASLAYASAEGDIREHFPGKLTSLDALVLGKVFSKNVGASVLAGVACAGWLLLMQNLLLSPLLKVTSAQALTIVKFPFMRAPFLTFLAVQPLQVFIFVIFGMLQPLALLTRYVRNAKVRYGIFVLLTLLIVSGLAGDYVSLPTFLVASASLVAGLLIPFFVYDLLAALISLSVFQFSDSIIQCLVVFPAWKNFMIGLIAVAAITLLIEFVAWRRGRLWRDEEVRPEYARHIAERQALQEEVSAAREAQLRLLPQETPNIPGLSIHASCLPARVVGGDFYDFFVLPNNRLGIFIAEGGNRGMASALTIALAKGYLMHVTRGPYSPTQVITKLEATLGSILDTGVARTTVAYAVIDPNAGTLSYARTGTYPRIAFAPADSSCALTEQEAGASIWEGSTPLSAGDSILFYTDGIARSIAAATSGDHEEWIRQFVCHPARNAEGIHGALLLAIMGAGPEHADLERDDDLTAVVVRCEWVGEQAREGVA